MLQMAPDYDNLTLMQKVEVFGYALDNTTGQDLYRVLWLKSKSSESWLERRTNYTRSLGVMSMVGYILGLGDRHPSNLMLDKITGKIIHIDFGDCFEVAMHREKYPERVPFRLTRMLTYAMEVSNIEGSFRITCENVMRVLRDNKESLMAVLEAVSMSFLVLSNLLIRTVHSRPSSELASYRRYIPCRTQFPLSTPRLADGVQRPPSIDDGSRYATLSTDGSGSYRRSRWSTCPSTSRTYKLDLSRPHWHGRCRCPRDSERARHASLEQSQGEAYWSRLQTRRGVDIYPAGRQATHRGYKVGEPVPALHRMVQFLVGEK